MIYKLKNKKIFKYRNKKNLKIIKVLGSISSLHYLKDKLKIGQEINLEFL